MEFTPTPTPPPDSGDSGQAEASPAAAASTPEGGSQLTPEQEEWLRQQQVGQAATAQSPAADQATVAAAMTDRGPTLPAEDQIEAIMRQARLMAEQLAQQGGMIEFLQKQLAEQQAASGGPMVVRYAEGARDKINTLVVQHPELGAAHFQPALDAANALVEEAQNLAKSGGTSGVVEKLAAAVERFATRTHKRQTPTHIDYGAILSDVDTAVEEALKLAA